MAIPVLNTNACAWKDGMNDGTKTAFGAALTAAAIAAAAYNANCAYTLAKKEWKLAKKYWKLADKWMQYYKNVYAPLENKELAEARKLKGEEPEYTVARGRAKASAWLQFKGLAHQAVRCTSKYCTGRRQDALEELASAQANALALCDALGYRNERAYIESRDDVRFGRQLATAHRGRNMVADAPTFGAAAAGIYGKLYDQAWEGLRGAGSALGYLLNRQEPAYPSFRYQQIEPERPLAATARPGFVGPPKPLVGPVRPPVTP